MSNTYNVLLIFEDGSSFECVDIQETSAFNAHNAAQLFYVQNAASSGHMCKKVVAVKIHMKENIGY